MLFNPQEWANVAAKVEAMKIDEQRTLIATDKGPVPTWSFSTLQNFEKCPKSVFFSKVQGCPDPAGTAAQRGTQMHETIEQYIMGETATLGASIKNFRPLIETLRTEYAEGKALVEEEWGHDIYWAPVENWANQALWLKLKLDVFQWTSPTSAKIIDWKSGRKYGNELKHNAQLQIYTLCAFHRFPQLQYVEGMMAYLDHGTNNTLEAAYTRQEALMFESEWHLRGLRLTTTTDFIATPSSDACRWCGHAKVQEGRDEPACKEAYI